MTERRRARRAKERRHPQRDTAKLKLSRPAIDRLDPSERERLTVKLPAQLIERLRDAVYWTAGVTITSIIERCVVDAVARMENERGSKFPPREAALRPGRPAKKQASVETPGSK